MWIIIFEHPMNKSPIAIAAMFAATTIILGTTLATAILPASAFIYHNSGNTVLKQIYSQDKVVSGYGNKIVQEHHNCIITPQVHSCS